ncbi:MAG: hypothetical protein JNL62_23690, partial [Bryobacterales bacterium]|nr:hypothetical protein [Bryobacterales bacterium]
FGKEIVSASVLGRTLLAGIGGRPMTQGAVGSGSLLLGFGTSGIGLHRNLPFDSKDIAWDIGKFLDGWTGALKRKGMICFAEV